MQKLIFDTHAHYTAERFNPDRNEILASLPQKGVALVLDCGTDLASTQQSLLLAEKYSWLYTAAGIHPQSLIDEETSLWRVFNGDWQAELQEIEKLLHHPKVVAIGECGLDNHWPVPKQAQLQLFEAHIALAQKHALPLILHDREAHGEMYPLLKKHQPAGVLHSFAGSAQDVGWITGQGLYLGFTGVVTFKNAKKTIAAAAATPINKILLETDCPYMAPVPYRGQRSDSSMITKTAEAIAQARGMQTEDLLRQTKENGKRLFGKIAVS